MCTIKLLRNIFKKVVFDKNVESWLFPRETYVVWFIISVFEYFCEYICHMCEYIKYELSISLLRLLKIYK